MRLVAILIVVACGGGGDTPVTTGVAKASPVLVGIEKCDQALAELQTCIETRAPGDAQADARDALAKMRESFRTQAGTEDVEQACLQAVADYARTNASWGCQLASAPVFDDKSCDQALVDARKCVDADTKLDAAAKQLAIETLTSLAELWGAQSKLPDDRRQVACKYLLTSIAKATADVECP